MSISKLLLAAAAAVFAQYPEAEEVHVTEDGSAFLPVAKHLAATHARANKLPDPTCITRKQMEKVDQLKNIVQSVSKAVNESADRVTKEQADKAAEAEAEAVRKAADEAEAAAQAEAEEVATAEAKAKKAAKATTKPTSGAKGKKGK